MKRLSSSSSGYISGVMASDDSMFERSTPNEDAMEPSMPFCDEVPVSGATFVSDVYSRGIHIMYNDEVMTVAGRM